MVPFCVAWASDSGSERSKREDMRAARSLKASPGTGTVWLLLVAVSVRSSLGSRTSTGEWEKEFIICV